MFVFKEMTTVDFEKILTAIVTPFDEKGNVDRKKIKDRVEH